MKFLKKKKPAKKKPAKLVHCKCCGGKGFEPDGLKCAECKGKGKVKE